MGKILAIARSEYLTAVRSKAFLAGLILMPVFMGGTLIVTAITKKTADVTPRRFAVVDRTGQIYPAIERAAKERNEQQIFDKTQDGTRSRQLRPEFLPELFVPSPEQAGQVDIDLSKRVREGRIFAFVTIGSQVISLAGEDTEINYHSLAPTFRELPGWLERVINAAAKDARFAQSALDRAQIERLIRNVKVRRLGLSELTEAGGRHEATEDEGMAKMGVAAGAMFMLFAIVMMTAPQMLNNVLEEKMQKIAELLISCVSPFQLMLGKLLGTVLVALTLCVLYLGTVYYLTVHFEVSHLVPLRIYLWLLLFTGLALIMFGSVFSAVGAACSEIRDAQSLMMPIMLLVILPLLCWVPIAESPASTFARLLSLFPPATPMIMLLRIGLQPGPPWWEVALGVVLTTAFALGCVWAGGKVFRIGILAQGQTPSLVTLVRWVFTP